MNSLKLFKNDLYRVRVKIKDTEVLFNVEDIARALGFIEIKGKKPYVMYRRVGKYLSAQVSKDDYITESKVYLLMFKANNQLAVQFQTWLAEEVLPSINRYGAYIGETATKEDVNNLERFSKLRIRRTFSKLAKGELENTFTDYMNFTETLSAPDRIVSYKNAIKGLEAFKEKYKEDIMYVALAIDKINKISFLKNKTDNRVNGAIKGCLKKKVVKLQKERDYYEKAYIEEAKFLGDLLYDL